MQCNALIYAKNAVITLSYIAVKHCFGGLYVLCMRLLPLLESAVLPFRCKRCHSSMLTFSHFSAKL
ncbi:conserved domain protein [Ruminococcus albus 8]|uniref:Conserved domain protein n=1 Tax=Ruminococcus albus 8 TaxID=246199 RepID=E9SF54_RUMAL|nr:conserved domain protein [Ruminococcus albus 8]